MAEQIPVSGFNEAGGFLPRKPGRREVGRGGQAAASMRPEDFSPGNQRHDRRADRAADARFNEAGGFLPRKRGGSGAAAEAEILASMRPEDFSPGNAIWGS